VLRTIADILAGAALIQMAFSSVILVLKRTENPPSNRMLALLLFSNVLVLTNLFVFKFLPATPRNAHLYSFGFSFSILWGPLLYLYTRSVTRRGFMLRKPDLVHALPFAAHLVFMTFHYRTFEAVGRLPDAMPNRAFTWNEHLVVIALIQGQILIYTILCFRELMRYRAAIRNTMSTVERFNLSWLAAVQFGFLGHWTLDTAYYADLHITHRPSVALIAVSMLMLLVFAQILVTRSLRQPMAPAGLEARPKYQGSGLTEVRTREHLADLRRVMDERKPYLDPLLTLPQLARMANIPPRHLSQILNESLGQNFFDFVNSHRIEESKRVLRDASRTGKTVLEVLLDVGFNSKSAFNSAFKRYTGMTPTSFIRSL
jgi:AraC-like DNA-binding protein